MITKTSPLLAIDDWLSKSPKLTKQTQIDDLGYKQLNDLLLLNQFPHLTEASDRPLGKQLLHYQRSLRPDLIASIDFATYKEQAAKVLRELPPLSGLGAYSACEVQALAHDLAYITYTLERWGQFSGRHTAGITSKSFQIAHLGGLSLYKYLTTICPKFNTIETFALSFTDEVERFEFPTDSSFGSKRTYSFNSPFRSQPETRNKTRYPTELPVGSFHVLVKKCELVAQCYNDLLLDFFDLSEKEFEPNSEQSVIKIDQIVGLVRFNQNLMLEFLKDDSFDEEKFAYILRQNTIETSLSPFNVLFEDMEVPFEHRCAVRGLANHFLKMPKFNDLELDIFLSDLKSLLDEFHFYSVEEKECLIAEVAANQGIGIRRYRFTLEIIGQRLGFEEDDLAQLLKDGPSRDNKLRKLNELRYEYAPSGANSLAFFGLDVLSGTTDIEPNYNTHILNRLGVMTEFDNSAFLRLNGHMKSGVPGRLRAALTNAIDPNMDDIRPVLPEHVIHYFVLFEEIARLSSIHQAMVNRFLTRFSSRMHGEDRRSLTSSLEHGTTFMSPSRPVKCDSVTIQLPSLGSLNSKRRSHYLKGKLDNFLKNPTVREKVRRLRHIDPSYYEAMFS